MATDRSKYAMVGLAVALLTTLGFSAMPEATHYCDEKQLQAHCFSLSQNGHTCYTLPNNMKGKTCMGGYWKEIFKPVECPAVKPIVVAYTDNGKYICDGVGSDAKCINKGFDQITFGDLDQNE